MMINLYLSWKKDKTLNNLWKKESKKVLTNKNNFDKLKKLKRTKNFEN